jgi:hypothetical protein
VKALLDAGARPMVQDKKSHGTPFMKGEIAFFESISCEL